MYKNIFGFFRPIEYSFLEPVTKMVWLFDINMQFPGRTVANVWRPRENLNVEHQADNIAGVCDSEDYMCGAQVTKGFCSLHY